MSVPLRPTLVHLLIGVIFFFFFNDTATTEIYTLSLHDALPISTRPSGFDLPQCRARNEAFSALKRELLPRRRSEEHTSELQSLAYLVCRLLLEKKKNNTVRDDTAQINARTIPMLTIQCALANSH